MTASLLCFVEMPLRRAACSTVHSLTFQPIYNPLQSKVFHSHQPLHHSRPSHQWLHLGKFFALIFLDLHWHSWLLPPSWKTSLNLYRFIYFSIRNLKKFFFKLCMSNLFITSTWPPIVHISFIFTFFGPKAQCPIWGRSYASLWSYFIYIWKYACRLFFKIQMN